MKRFVVVIGVVALLAFPRLAGAQCDPIQLFEPYGWLVGNGCCFEPADVANRIEQGLIDAGVRVRDAELAKERGLYERYDLYVSELWYQDHGNGTWEADLLVSVSDWKGKKFKPGMPPAIIEPCEGAHLLHSRLWHIDSEDNNAAQAIANYYVNNRNTFPSMQIPALTPLGLAALIVIIFAGALYAMYKQSPAAD